MALLLIVMIASVGFSMEHPPTDADTLRATSPVADSAKPSVKTDTLIASPKVAPVIFGQDSTSKEPFILTRENKKVTSNDSSAKAESTKFVPKKTPMLALGLSAVLPGAGQVYDEKYWKVPVILGLGGYWVYEWIQNNKQYQDYREQYLNSLVEIPGAGNGRYQQLRDFYRDERDKFAWYLGVLYFANLLDAYVSAHLYDFDVSPDLSSRPGAPPQIGMALRFKLH